MARLMTGGSLMAGKHPPTQELSTAMECGMRNFSSGFSRRTREAKNRIAVVVVTTVARFAPEIGAALWELGRRLSADDITPEMTFKTNN